MVVFTILGHYQSRFCSLRLAMKDASLTRVQVAVGLWPILNA
jgi:hypothetical protein